MRLQLAEDDRPPIELSLDKYLHSNWRPDCDFVDGLTEERNVGTLDHSCMVSYLLWALSGKQEWKNWPVTPLPGLRMRVSPTRVRVPDVCVIARGGPREQILTHPPLAIFEVLDEEDRFSATMKKLEDFARFSVEYIWIIDPANRRVDRYVDGGLERVRTDELDVPETPIGVVLTELFAQLDRV
jgi:Uma2 family endonuclease